ncbi:DUF2398 family protein [Actinokineospora spheciospongiae]|uniref:DUF2398 family protein n=1 Tax=Actinokineospora spheciospongiae TaxID=909613 RepID=UPI000D7196F7|nr:DUF2398 family protein [Actinokineospora spheciospongiae]PWW60220.1 uncharacterized protein (TIGR02678 family) [Actinokineospora spheciospongiae]
MRQDTLLPPDLADCARQLAARGRLLAERDPELYRTAVLGQEQLGKFFATELGWRVDVVEHADMVRLHKRRQDVPGTRGPRLRRESRDRPLAPRLVLIVVALVCEQLWRRPRITVNDLMQAVSQVCAADSADGLLPRFRIVPDEEVGKREARENRQSIVDALRLLDADGTIVFEGDLDHAVDEDGADGVVAASRDRLSARFSSLSPSLLKLSQLPPDRHVEALASDRVPDDADVDDGGAEDGGEEDWDTAAPGEHNARTATTVRRHRAVRRLVDDPGTDPVADHYLQSSTGRNRALNVLHALGLVGTVRRDWWQVGDPTGLGSTMDFPHGRRMERQAALALLRHLGTRPMLDGGEAPVTSAEIESLFERIRERLPRWAAAYDRQQAALARAAASELVDAGFLVDVAEPPDQATATPEPHWRPTPAARMWQVKVTEPDTSDSHHRSGGHHTSGGHQTSDGTVPKRPVVPDDSEGGLW